jgi:hypothetical protein
MPQFDRLRIGLTVLVTLAIWSLLIWQHFHGGVPAHYLFQNPELPRMSNWYGGLILPALTWGLLGLTKRRMMKTGLGLGPVIVGLAAGSVFGIGLSVTFFSSYQSVTGYLFLSLLPLAFFLPAYRAECLLGFILGMSTAFGAILPTMFGFIMALVTFVIHRCTRWSLRRLTSLRRRSKDSAEPERSSR